MKKVSNLAVIILAIVFMSCSCEKEDPIVPDPETIISSTEFEGDWMFQSITLDSDFGILAGTHTECDALNGNVNEVWDYVTLSINSVTAATLYLYSDCMDAGEGPDTNPDYTYTIELVNDETIINCDESRKFKVNYYTEPFLELELTHSTSLSLPVGAVYLLKRVIN